MGRQKKRKKRRRIRAQRKTPPPPLHSGYRVTSSAEGGFNFASNYHAPTGAGRLVFGPRDRRKRLDGNTRVRSLHAQSVISTTAGVRFFFSLCPFEPSFDHSRTHARGRGRAGVGFFCSRRVIFSRAQSACFFLGFRCRCHYRS